MAMSQTLQKVERDCDFGVPDEIDEISSLSCRRFFAGKKSLRVRKEGRKKGKERKGKERRKRKEGKGGKKYVVVFANRPFFRI
jgi:hypothetical protein